jgi:hypothetical protein
MGPGHYIQGDVVTYLSGTGNRLEATVTSVTREGEVKIDQRDGYYSMKLQQEKMLPLRPAKVIQVRSKSDMKPGRYVVGDFLSYKGSTGWIPVEVIGVNRNDGSIQVDQRPGKWFSVAEQAQRFYAESPSQLSPEEQRRERLPAKKRTAEAVHNVPWTCDRLMLAKKNVVPCDWLVVVVEQNGASRQRSKTRRTMHQSQCMLAKACLDSVHNKVCTFSEKMAGITVGYNEYFNSEGTQHVEVSMSGVTYTMDTYSPDWTGSEKKDHQASFLDQVPKKYGGDGKEFWMKVTRGGETFAIGFEAERYHPPDSVIPALRFHWYVRRNDHRGSVLYRGALSGDGGWNFKKNTTGSRDNADAYITKFRHDVEDKPAQPPVELWHRKRELLDREKAEDWTKQRDPKQETMKGRFEILAEYGMDIGLLYFVTHGMSVVQDRAER